MVVSPPSKIPTLEDTLSSSGSDHSQLPPELAEELKQISLAKKNPEAGVKHYQRLFNEQKKRVRQEVIDIQKNAFEGKPAHEQQQILSDPSYHQTIDERKRNLEALETESFKLNKNPQAFFDEREAFLEEQRRRHQAEKNFKDLSQKYEENYPGIGQAQRTSYDDLYDPTQYLSPELRKQVEEERRTQKHLGERKKDIDELQRLREHPDPMMQKRAEERLRSDPALRDLMRFYDRRNLEEDARRLQQAQQAGVPPDERAFDDFHKKQGDLLRRYPELGRQDKPDENPLTLGRPVQEHKDDFGGKVILHATDIHDNVRGIEALSKRARELKEQGKLSSVVLGGDLVRGAFDDKEDLIEYQKLQQEFGKLQHQLGGVMLHPISYLQLAQHKKHREHIKQGKPEEFQRQLDHALDRYVQLYEKGKERMKRTMKEMLSVAKKYGIDQYLMVVPGNYEGTELLEEVFDEGDAHRVMGFKNLAEYHHQTQEEDLEHKDRFKSRVINRNGLRFFGYGGSMQRTDPWIPKELQDYYPDLEEAQFDQIRMLALSSVLQPIIADIPEAIRTEIMEGRFSPFDLYRLEQKLSELAKKDNKFTDDRFKHLESQFKKQFDLIITEFQPDAKFLRRKIQEAEADVHIAHHPLGSDMSYYDDKGVNDGGLVAYQTIKSTPSYKLGLYGHSHRTNLDVVRKDDGSYFFGIQTKGLNYRESGSDDKFGLASSPVSPFQRGEFAEIGLDDKNELAYVTLHQTMGDALLKDMSSTYTREELIDMKTKPKKGRESVESFDHFNYLQSSQFLSSKQ